jgi:hypothetical protein
LGATVFLVDDTTDVEFLNNLLEQLWRKVAGDSPNASNAEGVSADRQRMTIFHMSNSKHASSRQLVKLLIEACATGEAYNQDRGRVDLKGVIEDLQLLAADASVQIEAVGQRRQPGKKVLEAGYSCDPDFDTPHYLVSWKLINQQQCDAMLDVHEAVQEVRCGGSRLTASAMAEDPAWQAMRDAARNCLKALGKRRRTPTSRAE